MLAHEHTRVSPRVADEKPTSESVAPRARAIAVSIGSLGVGWIGAAISYGLIASVEGIGDGRALQVTAFGAGVFAILSAVSVVLVLRNVPRRRAATILGCSTLRRVVAASIGMAVFSVAAGVVMLTVATLPTVTVTPPAAWLITTTAGVFGAIAIARQADRIMERRTFG